MENCILISAYSLSEKNGQVYRNYYVIFNGVYTQVKIDSKLEFVKENVKKCPCYSHETLKKLMLGEIDLDKAETITYKTYCSQYGVK